MKINVSSHIFCVFIICSGKLSATLYANQHLHFA